MAHARDAARTYGKSDPIDALAVARAALREPDLPAARLDGPAREVRLLVDHREDLVGERTRLHQPAALAPARARPDLGSAGPVADRATSNLDGSPSASPTWRAWSPGSPATSSHAMPRAHRRRSTSSSARSPRVTALGADAARDRRLSAR